MVPAFVPLTVPFHGAQHPKRSRACLRNQSGHGKPQGNRRRLFTPYCSKRASGTSDDVTQSISFDIVLDFQFEAAHRKQDINGPGNPVLVFFPGLDGKVLPNGQAERLRQDYSLVSVCHRKDDRSNWVWLVKEANRILKGLRTISEGDLTIVGESFGAALALRVAAETPPNIIKRLVLINPGTAILKDRLLFSATSLLPLLKVDRTERFLYKAAAVFLFRVLLTREELLAEVRVPEDELQLMRSVDIDEVPLDTMLHRVALLKRFDINFSDSSLRHHVKTPTMLIASGRDKLLQSKAEIERLSCLLSNVDAKIILEESGHAALLERGVSLASILRSNGKDVAPKCDESGIPYDDGSRRSFDAAYRLGERFFGPWRKLTSPTVLGKHNLQRATALACQHGKRQRPVLLVGNHTVFGILDLSVLFMELQQLLGGNSLRSLADAIHFEQFSSITDGRWSKFVSDLGAVPANPRNFYKLLSASENILLFPGGAREVCRRKGEQYKLFWKSDTDFVRPAARFDAIIVPFSAVGADECVDILVDGQEVQQLPFVGKVVQRLVEENNLSTENLMPITSFPPKPQPLYFKFQQPVDTVSIDPSDPNACRKTYLGIKSSVECGVDELLQLRKVESDSRRPDRDRKNAAQLGNQDMSRPTGLERFLQSILPSFDL